jgi:hypothetical protein
MTRLALFALSLLGLAGLIALTRRQADDGWGDLNHEEYWG